MEFPFALKKLTQQSTDLAVFIIQIAEDTCLRRAGLDTPGLFSFLDSMITEGAFLHNALLPDPLIGLRPVGIVIGKWCFGFVSDFLSTGG